MSQYLYFTLKKKNSPDTLVMLDYFCTTPARQFDLIGAFPFAEKDVLLTEEVFKSYQDNVMKEMNSYKKRYDELQEEIKEVQESIYKCSSLEVAQMFLERLDDTTQYASDYKEDLDEWSSRLDSLKYVYHIWQMNKDDWDLYYSNC